MSHDLQAKAAAYAEAMLASDMAGSGDGVWGVRLDREVRTKDWSAAVTSFERVAAERRQYVSPRTKRDWSAGHGTSGSREEG
jgi:hypothetical protein